jgi:hypothetical protein
LLSLNPHWLRFNCQSTKSKQPSTGQRLFNNETVPLDLKIENLNLIDNCLHIKWTNCSGQDDTIIPIEYIINNYPSNQNLKNKENYQRFKTSQVC